MWLVVLHCFLEASSIYSSIKETKEVQRLIMKVGSINMCLLSCQFYYTYKTCNHCVKYLFWVRESVRIQLWTFIVVQQREGRPKSDGCSCEGRGGQNFSLCGGHKWVTPKWKEYRNLSKDLKFLIWDSMYQSYLSLIIYRFLIHLLLMAYKLYSF